MSPAPRRDHKQARKEVPVLTAAWGSTGPAGQPAAPPASGKPSRCRTQRPADPRCHRPPRQQRQRPGRQGEFLGHIGQHPAKFSRWPTRSPRRPGRPSGPSMSPAPRRDHKQARKEVPVLTAAWGSTGPAGQPAAPPASGTRKKRRRKGRDKDSGTEGAGWVDRENVQEVSKPKFLS